MKMSEQTVDLYAALAKAQGAMQNADVNKANTHFGNKYADLASIRDATVPALSANGLAIIQFATLTENGDMRLITRLVHSSGQWMEGEYPLPNLPDKPQVMGSAITYAKRYCWSAVCGIASEEDDDGNAAQDAAPKNGNGVKANGKAAPKQESHPDDLGVTDYKAGLRAFEQERNTLLTALRGSEISGEEANDRYREICSGILTFSVNGKEKKVKTDALMKQCKRSPAEWRDREKDDFIGFERRLKETREELDRALAKASAAPPQDDPFSPESQEAAQ
jgi:hypothetical protein